MKKLEKNNEKRDRSKLYKYINIEIIVYKTMINPCDVQSVYQTFYNLPCATNISQLVFIVFYYDLFCALHYLIY